MKKKKHKGKKIKEDADDVRFVSTDQEIASEVAGNIALICEHLEEVSQLVMTLCRSLSS
jgi:hypothetical protein